MKKTKRIMLVLLAAVMVITCVGCGGNNTTAVVDAGSGEIPETLTIFASINTYATKAGAETNNDLLPYQEMEALTGCHVEWIHATSQERFNLTIASGKLPDMMVTGWGSIQGGAKMYADDGVIIPLRDLMEDNMPNLMAYNKEKPHVAKQYTDDSGEVYYIPFIRQDEELKVFQGPQMRQDWLEKLGLEAPKNAEELYTVLKAFKEKDPNGNGQADEIPMSGVGFENTAHGIGNLLWMFGTTYNFYQEDGEVKYGVMEDNFVEGLEYITKLYSEGLIDQDYLLNDREKMDGKAMNDKVGFVYSLQPGKYYTAMHADGRKVSGIPHPANDGVKNNVFDPSYIQDACSTSIAVTTANKNPSGSLKWLDNFFGGKGMEIFNFGKEGVSFDRDENGKPKLNDYIFNNPNGKNQQEMSGLSLGTYNSNFPGMQLWDYYSQILKPWGIESIETWSASGKTGGIIPTLSFTEDESETIARVMSQVETFVTERVNKIVIGNADISTIPEIRERINQMGIQEVIDIYNDALTRYNNR